jgi:hypothetical protein
VSYLKNEREKNEMDTATKAAAELRRQLVGLQATKQQNENGLAGERSTLRRATERRVTLVGELVAADEATTAWANVEIDRQDNTIRTTERRIQSYEIALARIDGQIGQLSIELTEAVKIVEQEKREQGLRVFRVQFQKAKETAERALASAREALAALNLTATEGTEQYGITVQDFVATVLQEFKHQQVNPQLLGWKAVRQGADLSIMLYPMERK